MKAAASPRALSADDLRRFRGCPRVAANGVRRFQPAELVEGFTRNTFTAMVEGVRDDAIRAGLTDASRFDEGVRALYRSDVFCYTFFEGVGRKTAAGRISRT